ncbi:MAG: thrombospondin type 3 repeat-containing protein, partial [Anaerolineales bacterium]|nr:thrombospondin type 3 repeat-containing protein [Anaerolineales bacterium]
MQKRQRFNWLFIAVMIAGAALAILPANSMAAPDQSPQAVLEQAWDFVQASGSYHFSSRIIQTTHPAPSIANAGRSSRVESVYLEGSTDLQAETILMRMWQGDGHVDHPTDAFEIRVEGHQTFGRISSGAWQEMEDFTTGFAPGNDFSAFLAAARNVKTLENTIPNVERLGFELSGPVLAAMIRDQLEAHLQRQGELPAGVRLSTPEQYRNAIGSGEVWVDGDGLPIRLSIEIQYPQQQNGERAEAQIITDFSNYNREAVAQVDTPADQVRASVSRLAGKIQKPETLVSVSFCGLLILAFINRRSKKVYTLIVLVVIFSMVVTPLLESAKVYAFSQKQHQAEAQYQESLAQRRAAQEAEAELYDSNWDPHQSPLAASAEILSEQASAVFTAPDALSAAGLSRPLASGNATSSGTDTDGDGLADEDDPCPDNPDCDGDGLTDLQELRLGADPKNKDTDGDLITDDIEVAGFWYNNQWWYSNPLKPDSNNDGLLDGLECPTQARPDQNSLSPQGQICQDTDGDGVPDIFDRDNDGDGVPDPVDLSPFEYADNHGDPFNLSKPLLLQVDSLQAGRPAFVDFQIRPQDTDHLWYALNVLDWPSGDEAGQIQRKAGNDSTFAELASADQPASEAASNGDMRLIPMLEIEMTGDTVPLALTNPQIKLQIAGDYSGSLHMEQAAEDIQLVFYFDTAGSYTVDFYDSLCPASGDALYSFSGINDQSQENIAGEYLVNLADGQHSVTFSNGSQTECVEISNLVNGPYLDQMVDSSVFEPYGITVREKSSNGTLLAYVPLNIVANETGSDRVAFSARMIYQPATGDWGDTQKVRLVWLVQMLVDRCANPPCKDAAWELNQTAIVHAYDDDWYLSGMAVREDHGLDIAVIYQDPAQMPSDTARQYDDFLWLMAWGLDASFIAGRDEDGDGQRDITVAEIYNRWGDPASVASDAMRWDIPITATQVMTYHYEHQDYYIHIAMTETQNILADVFTGYVDQGSDAPTLLFAQEAHYRGANLDSELTEEAAISDTLKITVQLDPEKSKEEVRATLNWGPYRYTSGEWQSYPIQEYWDRMQVRFKEICKQYEGDPDYENIRKGQVFIAQSFYLALFRGDSALVQIGDDLMGNPDTDFTDLTIADLPEELMIEGSTLIAVIGSISEVIEALVEKPAAIKELKDFLAFVGALDQQGQYSGFFRKHHGEIKDHYMDVGAAFLSLAVITLYCVAIAIENDPIYHVLNGYFMVQAVWEMIKTTRAMYKAAEGLTKAQKVLAALKAEGSTAIGKLSIIGLIVGAVISWGLFAWQIAISDTEFGSMAFNFAFAHQTASILAALLMLAIAAIPIVGQIIALIINLFDGIVYFVCGLAESEHPICLGIQGWMTAGIRWTIYSGNVMVDLADESRLEITEFQQELLDASLGLTPNNHLIVSATTENTIHLIDWRDTDFSLLAGSYWWQYDSDALSSSTFRYYLDEETGKHTEELSRNVIRGYEWDPDNCDPEDRGCTYTESDSAQIPMPDPGINRAIDLYLTEKFAIPAQECWVVPIPYFPFVIPVCYIRTERGDSAIDLGQSMLLDVFPTTLDEFYTLTAKEGGYALAWSQDSSPSFPRLQDADGDGLRTKAMGGADPNDLLWDSDGDGLSDAFEMEIGSDPEDVDSDDDGLSDFDEVLHNTNVNLADTDYDGLTDKEEIDGWEFVYDFSEDGSPLTTWVTSDPLTIDGDLDSFTDFQEKTYGFHPGVVSDPNVLTLSSQVFELNNPTLILRLNGVADATSFSDDSGFLNNGLCSDAHCPASGHLGKYGNAPHFDGVDDTIAIDHADTLMPANELTMMAWVYLVDPSSNQKIAGKSGIGNGFLLGVEG